MEISNGTSSRGLADFIRSNIETILKEWVAFAQNIPSAKQLNFDALLDHAETMLLVIADDLDQPQTALEQYQKSKGLALSAGTATNADRHGAARMLEGFDVDEMASEFRALRASVTRLWLASHLSVRTRASDDLIRFNEAIDQALAESLRKFSHDKNRAEEERSRSENLYRTLFESIDQAFAIIELLFDNADQPIDYRFLVVNPSFRTITGIEDAVGHTARELVPDLDECWPKTYGHIALTGESIRFQNYEAAIDRHYDVYAFRIDDPADRRVAFLFSDITHQKKSEEQLQLAAAVYQDSSEAMLVTDQNNDIIAVNRSFTSMTGYELEEVIGKNPRILKSDRHDHSFYEDMWQQIISSGHFKGEIWNKKKSGAFFAAQLTINTMPGSNGAHLRYVALLSDITDKKLSDEMIWTQANYDALTGLPNRRLFKDHLQQEVRKARRFSTPIALMFMDLDGFKHVNDTLGHDVGDQLLKQAAKRLKGSVRDIDTVARLGGDEFTVILSDLSDAENAGRVARHILKVLSEPYQLDNEIAYVSASIGITFYPQDAEDIENLVKNADQAMYAAKQEGKNQYHYFTPEMQEAAIARMRLVNDLRGALEANQLELAYQPIVELSTGTIQKAEALIRWKHPERGLINPVEFISAAEDTGLIASFGDWVFREAARQAAIWREQYHPEFQISVNISPVQFKNEGIDSSVWFDHLKDLGLPGQGIVVEITEGLLLDSNPKVTNQLLMLRDAGIEVALDDFGTGYSSLLYLKKFDIDYLKIDRDFVHNLMQDSDDLALCEAIIVMAHKLGLKVIAEGVETARHYELLANAGCNYAQGYLFSRPVSASELDRLLQADPFTLQKPLDL